MTSNTVPLCGHLLNGPSTLIDYDNRVLSLNSNIIVVDRGSFLIPDFDKFLVSPFSA